MSMKLDKKTDIAFFVKKIQNCPAKMSENTVERPIPGRAERFDLLKIRFLLLFDCRPDQVADARRGQRQQHDAQHDRQRVHPF